MTETQKENAQRGLAPETIKLCVHCRQSSGTGTHGGCYNCGRVKHTQNGRTNAANRSRKEFETAD